MRTPTRRGSFLPEPRARNREARPLVGPLSAQRPVAHQSSSASAESGWQQTISGRWGRVTDAIGMAGTAADLRRSRALALPEAAVSVQRRRKWRTSSDDAHGRLQLPPARAERASALDVDACIQCTCTWFSHVRTGKLVVAPAVRWSFSALHFTWQQSLVPGVREIASGENV